MFWITLWLVLMVAWLYIMGWLPRKSAREQAWLAKAAHDPEPQPTAKSARESETTRATPAASH